MHLAIDSADIHLSEKDLQYVRSLLSTHFPECETWAFGSRVTGEHLREFSDLDIAIKTDEPVALDRILSLKYDLVESDLPIKVDIVDWNALDKAMQCDVMEQHVILTTPRSEREGG